MRCAECVSCFKPREAKSCFCSPACKTRFHNRNKARGATLVPILMASRQDRGGELGRWAQGEWARLVAKFSEEDKVAGRMPMAQFVGRQQSLYLKP